MSTLIVIPARWGSTRLPGKPLLPIAGHSLLHRVIAIGQRAAAGRRAKVVVATDDERIVRHAEAAGCGAVLTDSSLQSGSDRVLAAADQLAEAGDRLVNLQGDAPFIAPSTVMALVDALEEMSSGCMTPVVTLDWAGLDALRERKKVAPFSGTTCVRDASGRALWFSKAILPVIRGEAALRDTSPLSPVHQHLGLYGYTRDTLETFCATPASTLERLEGLEQLRLIEAGVPVWTIQVPPASIHMGGIDSEQDVRTAESLIARFGDPHGSAGA